MLSKHAAGTGRAKQRDSDCFRLLTDAARHRSRTRQTSVRDLGERAPLGVAEAKLTGNARAKNSIPAKEVLALEEQALVNQGQSRMPPALPHVLFRMTNQHARGGCHRLAVVVR